MRDKLLDKLLQYAESSSIGGFFKSLHNDIKNFLILLGLVFLFGISIKNHIIVTLTACHGMAILMALSVFDYMDRSMRFLIFPAALICMQSLYFNLSLDAVVNILEGLTGIDINISRLTAYIVGCGTVAFMPLSSLMIFCFKKDKDLSFNVLGVFWFNCGFLTFITLGLLLYLSLLSFIHLYL